MSKGLPGLGDNLCGLRTKKSGETEYVARLPSPEATHILEFRSNLVRPSDDIQIHLNTTSKRDKKTCKFAVEMKHVAEVGGIMTNCAISINSPKAAKTVVECCSFSVCYIRAAGEEKSHAIFNKWAFEEGKNVKDVNNAVLIAKCL